jgi:tRNA pseudouridine55 synthase
MTSQKAVTAVKWLLKNRQYEISKIGHLGTLDPDAEGVLVIALGHATKLFDYHLTAKKTYITDIVFGTTTDTLDLTGKILQSDNVLVTSEQIENIIHCFLGEIEQIPPAYSAKSIGGVKAYRLARSNIDVELQPKRINIYSLDLIDEIAPNTFKFSIECSSGTYIRAIARDLATKLGTIGATQRIIRTQSGVFKLANAVSIEQLEASQNISEYIMSIDSFLSDYQTYYLSDCFSNRLLNGVSIQLENAPEGIFVLYLNDKIFALAEKSEDDYIKIIRRLM